MADEAGAAGGGTLPAAAQKTLVDELSKATESLLAVLDFLKAAPVSEDPAAVVPAEVTEQLEQVGMQVAALGDQFEAPAVAAPPEAGAVASAAPPAPGPVAMSVEEAKTLKGYARGLALKMHSAIAKRLASPAVAKAKVKLTFEQHAKLQSQLMSSLMDMLKLTAPMMNGLDDADVENAFGQPSTEAAPPPATPEAEKKKADEAAAKKLADEEAAKNTTVVKVLGEALGEVASMKTALDAMGAKIEKIGKSRGPSNAAPLEREPPAPPPDGGETSVIGRNFSAEYAEKQKKNGAKPNAGAAQ